MEIRDAHHQGGQKDCKNVDDRFAPVQLWPPFGNAGQAQTGRLPTANAYSIERLPAAYLGFSGFGVEEVGSFDHSATGKTISDFLESQSRSDRIASHRRPITSVRWYDHGLARRKLIIQREDGVE